MINIGYFRFATSWHTLTWVPDTFFTALLSGRIPTVRDETGAIFIDRDPNLFGLILNFLRTRDIDLTTVNIRALRHECDYFGITPLCRRLALCDEMNHSACGDVLFYGYLPPPCKLFNYTNIYLINHIDMFIYIWEPHKTYWQK